MACACGDANCKQLINKLRQFTDWTDLAAHTDEEIIVKWVNTFAKERAVRDAAHKRNQLTRKLLAKAASKLLDPDELRMLKERAANQALDEEGETRG